jgi:hypothetical protein
VQFVQNLTLATDSHSLFPTGRQPYEATVRLTVPGRGEGGLTTRLSIPVMDDGHRSQLSVPSSAEDDKSDSYSWRRTVMLPVGASQTCVCTRLSTQ